MIHALKIENQYFDEILEGKKTFEIRKKDRDYKVNDYLALNEIDEVYERYTGRSVLVKVICIVDDERFCKKDYVVMGIVLCSIHDNRTRELMFNIAPPITIDDIKIEELDLSVRAYNCLKRANINTLQDLSGKTIDDLKFVRNLEKSNIDEIVEKCRHFGIDIKRDGGK